MHQRIDVVAARRRVSSCSMAVLSAILLVAWVAVAVGVFLLVLAVGLWLPERAFAKEEPDPLETEVFGKRQARRLRRKMRADSPSRRLVRIGAAVAGGGLGVIAVVALLRRLT